MILLADYLTTYKKPPIGRQKAYIVPFYNFSLSCYQLVDRLRQVTPRG